MEGTTEEVCDLKSGCCDCKAGIIGELCQFCTPGKYKFPECKGKYKLSVSLFFNTISGRM